MHPLVSVSGRAGHGCRVAAVAAVVLFGHILPGRAQTHSPVWAENRNEVLASEPIRVPRWLSDPVVRAAKATNVDPANILALADKDAERLPVSRAQTASAEGPFQFVEGIWLEALRRYGRKHGYAAEAKAVHIVHGRSTVANGADRKRILDLRRDPYVSALMTGEMINTHRQILTGKIAPDPSFAELHMAHLLGVYGANRLRALLHEEPGKSLSDVRGTSKAEQALTSAFRRVSGT